MIVPKLGHNSGKFYNYTFPLGMAYISSALKKANFQVDVLNTNHHGGDILTSVKNVIEKEKYDVVLSGGTEDTFTQLVDLFLFVKNKNILTIVGGPILNGEVETIFPYLGANIGLYGEADNVIVDLIKCIRDGKDYRSLPSLIYNNGKEVQINDRAQQIEDLDKLPYPDFEGFGFREYLQNINCNATFYSFLFDFPRIYTICGSRGCAYRCTFCTHTIGDRYITRSIDSIIEELTTNIINYNINIVFLVDDMLSNNRDRIIEFCHKFKEVRQTLSWDCKWWSNFMCTMIDEELVDLLIESGCYMIGLGYESYSDTILKSMNKPSRKRDIDRTFNLIFDKKIALQANFILGDINETKQTFAETLDFFKNRSKGELDFFTIVPSLGTDLFKRLKESGRIRNVINYLCHRSQTSISEGYLNAKNGIKISALTHFCMIKKMIRYCHSYNKFIVPTLKKERKNIYAMSFDCPECHSVQTYKNISIYNKHNFYYYGLCRNCFKRFVFSSPLRKKVGKVPLIFNILFDIYFIFNKIKIVFLSYKQKITLSFKLKI